MKLARLAFAPRSLAVCTVLALASVATDAQRLWVVDPFGGPADFVRPQDAVDAASDGDAVLLRLGYYDSSLGAIEIRQKTLTLFAEHTGQANLFLGSPNIKVVGLRSDQHVVLRNLVLGDRRPAAGPPFLAASSAVLVRNCVGAVLLEDCWLAEGAPASLKAVNATSVTLARCRLDATLRTTDSFVSVYDSTIDGTPGVVAGVPGLEGCRVRGGELLLQGTTLTGGVGGFEAFPDGVCDVTPGGIGLVLHEGASAPVVRLVDSTVVGGPFGPDPDCSPPLSPAEATLVRSGSVVTLSGEARATIAGGVAREGTEVRLAFRGEPGDLVRAASSSGLGGTFYPPFNGNAVIGLPVSIFLQQALPTGGLEKSYPLSSAGSGVQAATVFVQSAFAEASGSTYLSSPSSLILADFEDGTLGQDCDGDGKNDLWEILAEGAPDYDLDGVLAECEAHPLIYVDDDAPNDPGPGTPLLSDPLEDGSPDHPFDAIQEAVDAAPSTPYTIVEVLDGVYSKAGNLEIDFGGKGVTVRGRDGASSTIVDCEGAGRGFVFRNGEGPTSRLEGVTIRNGRKDSPLGTFFERRGGAIFISGADPTIVDCVFESNVAGGAFGAEGGAIFAEQCSGLFRGCEFRDNSVSGGSGGALYIDSTFDAPRVEDCSFLRNRCDDDGGGAWISGGRPHATVTRCLFQDNVAGVSGIFGAHGGGLWAQTTSVSDCLVVDNVAADGGGGLYGDGNGYMTVERCTLVGNSLVKQGAVGPWNGGGGAMLRAMSVRDSVLWGNTVNATPEQLWVDLSVQVAHSDVQGGLAAVTGFPASLVWGPGNLDEDPAFVDPGAENYRLSASSPCRDAGDRLWSSALFDLDVERLPRLFGAAVDMGAHELQGP